MTLVREFVSAHFCVHLFTAILWFLYKFWSHCALETAAYLSDPTDAKRAPRHRDAEGLAERPTHEQTDKLPKRRDAEGLAERPTHEQTDKLPKRRDSYSRCKVFAQRPL